MKACPKCQRLFPDDARFCPSDGTALKPSALVRVPLDAEDPRVGKAICRGRYEIRRRVADGGMGRVYQALDKQAKRSVAIKVLHPEVSLDEVAVERFKREFELSSRLPHDHIVEVLDFQETEDESFALVMEYLEGEELRNYLQRERVARAERVIRIVSQLALGLREPHEQMFVHRDIKPDNVFLCDTPDGPVVKLLDFGSVRDNSKGAKKLTAVGTTIGSPFYMSPEQAQGLPELDHRADVWAIAAIAYEALTGKVPFHGVTGPQILLAILSKEPTPPSVVSHAPGFPGDVIPDTVDDAIADALTKSAAIRLGSVAAFADRLGRAYGLSGDHKQWATTPEQELARLMASATQRGLGPGSRRTAESAVADRAAAGSASPRSRDRMGEGDRSATRSEAERDNPFPEDDFAMGVPQTSPIGVYVVAGAVGLVLIAGALFFLLR